MGTGASMVSTPNLKQRASVHCGKFSHNYNREHRTSASPKVDQRVTGSFHTSDDVEKREILDVPTPTLSEVIQVIRDSWELGLHDDTVFLALMDRIKRLLDECIVGGEAGKRRHGEQHRFDSHWQEGAEMNPRVRVNSGEMAGEMEQDNCSDARSMTYSAYTVRSVTSFQEKTSQLVWPRNEKRDTGNYHKNEEGVVPATKKGLSRRVFRFTIPTSKFERLYRRSATPMRCIPHPSLA